jgi:ribosomal protein S12 methylthiotransferase accessory factor
MTAGSAFAPAGREGLGSLVSPIGGLIRRVQPLPIAPGEPDYAISAAELGDLTQVLPQVAVATGGASTAGQVDGAGGGITRERASTIAIAEALERYSSCCYDSAQFVWATAEELGGSAMDLDGVPRCTDEELAHPECPVTSPNRNARIRWVRGVSLHTGEPRWIPAMMA